MTKDQVVVSGTEAQPGLGKGWILRGIMSLLISSVIISIVALGIMFRFRSAWDLLGVGRGLVPPEYYPYSALVVILGTTFGQFVGWAAGSALLAYVWYRVRGRVFSFKALQVAMTLVYCGLAFGPISLYHSLFGQPLAGIPRPALSTWLAQHYPNAYDLLITGHPWVDWSVLPIAIVVLVLLWKSKERVMHRWAVQTLLFFLIMLTSFVVALSLAIHSTLVHIRMG